MEGDGLRAMISRIEKLDRHGRMRADSHWTYRWDPAAWREPTWFQEKRVVGFRIWFTGGEIQLGKWMWRFRWLSQ
jgi:hypothetical protein